MFRWLRSRRSGRQVFTVDGPQKWGPGSLNQPTIEDYLADILGTLEHIEEHQFSIMNALEAGQVYVVRHQ